MQKPGFCEGKGRMPPARCAIDLGGEGRSDLGEKECPWGRASLLVMPGSISLPTLLPWTQLLAVCIIRITS